MKYEIDLRLNDALFTISHSLNLTVLIGNKWRVNNFVYKKKHLLTVKAPVSTTLHSKHIAKKNRITDESLKPPKCDTPNTTAIIRNAIFVSVLILLKR